MTITRLDEAARAAALAGLTEWKLADDCKSITRIFVFADFSEAFGFMSPVALEAEKVVHHPEWSNVWNRIEIRLTTHDVDGLSARDMSMAAVIDRML